MQHQQHRQWECKFKFWVNNNMILNELYDLPKPGYQSEKDDNTPLKLSDLRKTRLTLADINRMRMANDIRKVEHETKLEKITQQYKPPAAAPAGI